MKTVIEIDDNHLKTFQDYVSVRILEDNGAEQDQFHMTLSDLIETLDVSGITEEIEERIETPYLPHSTSEVACIKHVNVSRKTNTHDYYMVIPKNQWNIIFGKEQLENVGFPRMLFRWRVSNNDILRNHLRIFALEEHGRVNGDTELFMFPFSHVQASGNVCMGGNVFPVIRSAQQLETMHKLFINAPFSGDYGIRTTQKFTTRELFMNAVGIEFPDEWLVSTKKTINQFFQLEVN